MSEHRIATLDEPGQLDDCVPPHRTSSSDWLSIARVAERLDVRVDHLRALVARGEIPFGRVGRLVRFHWPTVRQWVERSGHVPAQPSPLSADEDRRGGR